MNAKEIVEKLRLTFNELVQNAAPAEPTTETAPEMVAPIKAKLADGTEVEITELGVGGVVTMNGAPAPVGDLQLEDGTTLTIGDNGAITAIVPVEPMVEDMSKMKTKDNTIKLEEVFAAFETSTKEKFSHYEAKFAEYEAKLEKATKVIEGLLNLTQTLAEQPTGVPDQSVKTTNNFNEEKKKSYDILFN